MKEEYKEIASEVAKSLDTTLNEFIRLHAEKLDVDPDELSLVVVGGVGGFIRAHFWKLARRTGNEHIGALGESASKEIANAMAQSANLLDFDF